MILYHGSNVKISKIDLSKSKRGKDFGVGFYLSPIREQAEELSIRKTEQIQWGIPTVSSFRLDESQLWELKVLKFTEYTKDWAEFVLMNRRNTSDVQAHEFDVVIGPIADDAVGTQIRRYTSGLIDMDRFLQELKFMKGITFQYFFATERAIQLLKPISE
jgi:hypothetical protein